MYFAIIFPFKKGVDLHLNKLEFSIPNDALRQLSLVEIGYFVINSPWERTLETLHLSIHQSILRA